MTEPKFPHVVDGAKKMDFTTRIAEAEKEPDKFQRGSALNTIITEQLAAGLHDDARATMERITDDQQKKAAIDKVGKALGDVGRFDDALALAERHEDYRRTALLTHLGSTMSSKHLDAAPVFADALRAAKRINPDFSGITGLVADLARAQIVAGIDATDSWNFAYEHVREMLKKQTVTTRESYVAIIDALLSSGLLDEAQKTAMEYDVSEMAGQDREKEGFISPYTFMRVVKSYMKIGKFDRALESLGGLENNPNFFPDTMFEIAKAALTELVKK